MFVVELTCLIGVSSTSDLIREKSNLNDIYLLVELMRDDNDGAFVKKISLFNMSIGVMNAKLSLLPACS